MPRPKRRRRASAPPPDLTPRKLESFLLHLARTGSVTFAAARAGLPRRPLYKRRAADEAFAERWEEALQLGVERLQDDAMRRALNGTERAVFRNGKQVGSVQQFDNRLLQFLLKSHRPETYGERGKAAASPLPFDLAQRLAAARPRADAYDAAKEKRDAKNKKQGR
ncbi:MAG: terminase [Reyranella sp.]|uniref:hypothetical protein n=1 Tax=Reyranella sp. TaxID=1929291 RepID=UPI0011F47E3F|nr:hypothetical protein [Reyranella sp.]TAJ39003.1 MAG: terminase [Reyranella sp.]